MDNIMCNHIEEIMDELMEEKMEAEMAEILNKDSDLKEAFERLNDEIELELKLV